MSAQNLPNSYSKAPAERTPSDWADYWSTELKASKKWMQKFHSRSQKIEREYLSNPDTMSDDYSGARFNVFWANVQVLLSAVYAKLPAPEVDRTHLDQNDDVARVAALILERIFKFELKNLDDSPDHVYREAIKDRFVTGLGQAWPRYEFKETEHTTPAIMDEDGMTELAPAVTETVITDEYAPLDYVRWEDYFYSPCRTWEKRRWQARRTFMGKTECRERFGDIIAGDIEYKSVQKSSSPDDPFRVSPEPLAEIFEIWDLETKTVYWFSHGSKAILDMRQDPLKLSGFFPAKRPLIATYLSNAFLPRADYSMVQDQYQELNMLSARMQLLTEALRVVGLYDKTAEGVQRMLKQAAMNELIPVDNWAMFAEKGGIKGAIDWLPLDQIVAALTQMTMRKQALMQEIYEILGLSDIMRGQSVASETATAQQLKAQYGSARLQRVQQEVADFLTANTRTRAEIICNHWQPETIIERSQAYMLPEADLAFVDQAVQLLKSGSQFALRLTISADTVSSPDWNAEKQERIDFLQATSQFITMSMPLVQQNPGAGPFLMQMLQWAATGFRAGKQIEGVLDQAIAMLQADLAKPKLPKPPTAKENKDNASAEESAAKAEQIKMENAAMAQAFPAPGVQLPPGEGGPGRPPQTALPGPGQ